MSKLVWDQTGEKRFETGVKNGVLYVQEGGAYPKGVAWNGLTAITESPSGAEANPFYADDIKYANIVSAEEFGGTIEAFTYPDEFAVCDGSAELGDEGCGVYIGQQPRKVFGLCYRTTIGNDVDSAIGYKLHLVYGCLASPSERANSTINESPELMTMSWEFTTTPVNVTGKKPTSHLVIDSTKIADAKLQAIEAKLYGDNSEEATLPLPDEIATILQPSG